MVDPKAAARNLALRNKREQALLDARRASAQAEGRRPARRLLEEIPGTKRGGGGFGSTWELWRGYRKSSDIDLAMDGGDLMAAMAIVEGSDIPVDVLELSSCRPFIRCGSPGAAITVFTPNCDIAPAELRTKATSDPVGKPL